MAEAKTPFIRIGDFFFKYRNYLFPAVILIMFITFAPEYEYRGSELIEDWKDVVALIIGLSGLAVRGAVIGYAYIKRGGLNKQVYADTLVTEGLFTICRNPLYFGNMLIYFAVFLMHGNPWVIFLGTGLFYFIYSSIIAAEEYFLRNKFGEAFVAYCQNTPRWIPRLSKFKQATEGMEFKLKKALVKDYSTIGMTLISLALPELMELVKFYPIHTVEDDIRILVAIICTCVVFMLVVRFLKKTSRLKVS
ncbi:MAG: isoprenylcysteine carboxylmethyltransferase family protein [Rickettsiales bacterium]